MIKFGELAPLPENTELTSAVPRLLVYVPPQVFVSFPFLPPCVFSLLLFFEQLLPAFEQLPPLLVFSLPKKDK
jgi:hypothetical protein